MDQNKPTPWMGFIRTILVVQVVLTCLMASGVGFDHPGGPFRLDFGDFLGLGVFYIMAVICGFWWCIEYQHGKMLALQIAMLALFFIAIFAAG
jgi:hypothetical protein